MTAEDVVARAIDGVADGAPLNWGLLHGLAQSDDQRAALKWLHVLDRIADVHRSVDDSVADDSVTTRLAPTVTGDTRESGVWGRYRLVKQLGAGGFGRVHCAWDPQLERHIAIKILHEHVSDDRLMQHLLREGRALARIQHDNVVQVFGVESHGDRVGLCMQLVEGETLASVLHARGRFSDREAAGVGEDVCRALAAVHGAGYVHRDVKAQNVMRDRSGKIVLMDFGTGHDASAERRPRDIVGTPAYMAPELLDGQPASVRSDIYAVGVLLYHLVTGKYPVEGRTLSELVEAHRTGTRVALLDRRPDLPLSFVQIVSRAMAANPDERWPSAGAMLEALGALRSEAPAAQGRSWAQAAARGAAAALGVAAGLTLLGMVSSRYFTVALGREAFVAEGVRDWLYWGAVSFVAPAILVLLVLVGLSVLRVLVRLIRRLWPAADRLARRLPEVVRRLGLDDGETASAAALVASVGTLAAAWWFVWPQFVTLMDLASPNIATGSIERLAYLSQQFAGDHENYRLVFEWAGIAIAGVWWIAVRATNSRQQPVNRGLFAAGVATLVLTLLLLDFPYRLLYQAEFDAVDWQGRRCYVLGERDEDQLLFCPDLAPPRNRVVRTDSDDLLPVGTKLNPFNQLPPSPTERP